MTQSYDKKQRTISPCVSFILSVKGRDERAQYILEIDEIKAQDKVLFQNNQKSFHSVYTVHSCSITKAYMTCGIWLDCHKEYGGIYCWF